MWRIGMAIVAAMLVSSCNLTDDPPITVQPPTEAVTTQTPIPSPALTPLGPTPLPALGSTNSPALGEQCQVYTTYSGTDPRNVLSLRSEPSADAVQVFRVPTNVQVYRVPGSQEIEAEGYHWLNIIYVDPAQNRYQGWMARDSYILRGMRDPSIATLRPTGQQAAC
jgi:hypothetical protein